jgi:hypothetical protein
VRTISGIGREGKVTSVANSRATDFDSCLPVSESDPYTKQLLHQLRAEDLETE